MAEDKNEYQEILNEFIDLSLKTFVSQVESIILWGSMARGEIIPKLSDIDVIVFFREEVWKEEGIFENWSGMNINISNQIKEGFDSVISMLGNTHPWIKEYSALSIVPLTRKIFKSPSNPFYSSLINLGALISDHRILYGNDPIKGMPFPIISKKMALQSMLYVNRNTEMQNKRIMERPKDRIIALNWMIKNGFLATQCFLHFNGIHLFGGKKVLEGFSSNFPQLIEEIKILNDLWETRNSLLRKSFDDSYNKAIRSNELIKKLLGHLKIDSLALDSELFFALVEILGFETTKALYNIFCDEVTLKDEGKFLEAERYTKAIKKLRENRDKLIEISKRE